MEIDLRQHAGNMNKCLRFGDIFDSCFLCQSIDCNSHLPISRISEAAHKKQYDATYDHSGRAHVNLTTAPLYKKQHNKMTDYEQVCWQTAD